MPEAAADVSPPQQADSALIRAVARAYHWRKKIESGACSSIEEIASVDLISPSYVGRVFRLSLLAPDIVEAILDGRHGPALTLGRLLMTFPDDWEMQRPAFWR